MRVALAWTNNMKRCVGPGRGRFAWLAMAALVVSAALPGTAAARNWNPFSAESAYKFSLTGKVVHVADGDTFTLLVEGERQRIRMASIDAPEITKGPDRPGQPMAQVSRRTLSDLIAGRTLTLQCFEKDRYGRNICDVPLPDGPTANRQMVAKGMAWVNMEGRGKFMRDRALPELEQKAKQERLGIWRDATPIPPWVWRYDCWKLSQCGR